MLGPFIVDVLGDTLTYEDQELLCHPLVGGVVLFTRNYQSPEQLCGLVKAIKALRDPELLVCVDHEGGKVQRFRSGFTELPAMDTLGQAFVEQPEVALEQAEQLGYLMASELRATGVDVSFAPVLDLDKGISDVLQGGRAISAEITTVVRVARAYIKGMHRAGMAAIGKHFPGHGSVQSDSHIAMPVDERAFADIIQDDAQPFVELLQKDLQGIMPAHIIFPEVDSLPASLSTVWLNDVLRKQLGFNGVIVSDCLSMTGAAQIIPQPAERVAKALQAGCDLVLLCNDRAAQLEVVETLALPVRGNVEQQIMKLRTYHG